MHRSVNACLSPLCTLDGMHVTTVEGMGSVNSAVSPVQYALAMNNGTQCGYCTPGFVVSLFAEQHRPGRVGRCDTMALAGNLCRCTGYDKIVTAVMDTAAAMRKG